MLSKIKETVWDGNRKYATIAVAIAVVALLMFAGVIDTPTVE
jgi:hypothetical protein